jgi:dolichol-phosphate mannosyltransferase
MIALAGSGASGRSPRQPRRVIVVLPAFNEEHRIASLLEHIDDALAEAGLRFEIVVVDDGSTDRTAEIVMGFAGQAPVHLERHPVNLGLGATLRDALAYAVGMADEGDIIVTMDADDTHTPGLILRMTRMISEGYDVVVASRYREGSRVIGVPYSRRVLSRLASYLFRLLFPIRGIRDYTCGYRAYRAAVLKAAIAEYGAAFVDQDGFQCMVDVLLKLRTMNLQFGEVPFLLRYDFKEGGTKMDVRLTIRNTLRLVVRRRVGK